MWKSGNSFYTRVYSSLDALTAVIYFPCWFLTVSLEQFHKSTWSTTLHSHYSSRSKLASKPFNPLTICRLCLGKYVRTRIIHRNSQWNDRGCVGRVGGCIDWTSSALTVVRSPVFRFIINPVPYCTQTHCSVIVAHILLCCISDSEQKKKRDDWKSNSSEALCQHHGCRGFH